MVSFLASFRMGAQLCGKETVDTSRKMENEWQEVTEKVTVTVDRSRKTESPWQEVTEEVMVCVRGLEGTTLAEVIVDIRQPVRTVELKRRVHESWTADGPPVPPAKQQLLWKDIILEDETLLELNDMCMGKNAKQIDIVLVVKMYPDLRLEVKDRYRDLYGGYSVTFEVYPCGDEGDEWLTAIPDAEASDLSGHDLLTLFESLPSTYGRIDMRTCIEVQKEVSWSALESMLSEDAKQTYTVYSRTKGGWKNLQEYSLRAICCGHCIKVENRSDSWE